ncbi:hypothetical protein Ciccas_012155, partial [Cichlidogyrus casuarinus]
MDADRNALLCISISISSLSGRLNLDIQKAGSTVHIKINSAKGLKSKEKGIVNSFVR